MMHCLPKLSEQRGSGMIGMIGVLAVLSVMATTLVPNGIKTIHSQADSAGINHLTAIGEGVKAYMKAQKAWPPTLVSLSPGYVHFAGAQLTQNENGYLRYYFSHPTTSAFTNAAGIDAADLSDVQFLLITNLTRDEAPSVTTAAEFDAWWATDASATPGLFIYRGTLTEMFHRLKLIPESSGGSYQIDGTAINSGGATLSTHDRYHVKGSVIELDDQDPYATPEMTVSLVAEEGYTYCSPKWQREEGCGGALWLTTDGGAKGTPGMGSWGGSEIVAFDKPNLTYESGSSGDTSGEFSAVMNLKNFTGKVDVDGMHYVARNLTLGVKKTVDVFAGDILFSTKSDERLTSNNKVDVKDEDVTVFRPDTPGDYTVGTFIRLLDGGDVDLDHEDLGDIKAFSLVEIDTIVGTTNLAAGTFILAVVENDNLYQFTPTEMGSRTKGSYTLLLDSPDINISTCNCNYFNGLALIQEETVVGDVTLQPGQILGTLHEDDPSVGGNSIDTDDEDIFILDLTRTGSNSAGTATLLFDGSDVGLRGRKEEIDGIAVP